MIASVRPFFRDRLENLGYEEHLDAVDFNNVASKVLDDTFQLETNSITGEPANQLDHNFDYGLTLRVFKSGFRDPVSAYDEVDGIIDNIYGDLLSPSVRLGTNIKDIVPISVDKIPLSGSDDNDIILEFNFIVRLIMCFT